MATGAKTRLRVNRRAYLLIDRAAGKAIRQRFLKSLKTNIGEVLDNRRSAKYRYYWGAKLLTCSSVLRYSFAGFNEVSAFPWLGILTDDSTDSRRAGLMHGSAPFYRCVIRRLLTLTRNIA